MKNLTILILCTLLGCGSSGPSEDTISFAEDKYNENFLYSFDEARALKEGCWKSTDLVYAAYKDGKLDPSQYTSKNKHLVRLTTKQCIDDLEVQENEVILWNDQGDNSRWNVFPDVILFSVDEDNNNRGLFRFIQINSDVFYEASVAVEGPGYGERWSDGYGGKNLAMWGEDKTVGIQEFDKENYEVYVRRWLNRETLIYYHELAPRYTFQEVSKFSKQYRIVDEQEFKNLLKKRFIEFYQYAVQEVERNKSEEAEKKSKRKL